MKLKLIKSVLIINWFVKFFNKFEEVIFIFYYLVLQKQTSERSCPINMRILTFYLTIHGGYLKYNYKIKNNCGRD